MLKLTVYFFLAYLLLELKGSPYRSCSEALLKEKTSGFYEIQPFSHSNISNISCEILNNTVGLSSLENNAEETKLVKGYEPNFSYKKDIIYANFDEPDLDFFLETTIKCSQGMKYITYDSSPVSHKAVFWDKTEMLANEAPDGICKCFISFSCEEASNPNALCKNTNAATEITEIGYFSVKSSRLPLKTIYFGDTGHTNECVKYEIWKLKCEFKLMNVDLIFPKENYNCEEEKNSLSQHKLFDGKKETCLNYMTNFLQLEIQTLSKITECQIFFKNLQTKQTHFVLKNENNEECVKKENFFFECKPSKNINIFVFLDKKLSFDVCEIDVF